MKVEEMRFENMKKFLRDGPRLRYDYHVWVKARMPGRVLLAGLGCCGVGEMWVDEEPRHQDYLGYDDDPKEED